jgi:hypothetical protein
MPPPDFIPPFGVRPEGSKSPLKKSNQGLHPLLKAAAARPRQQAVAPSDVLAVANLVDTARLNELVEKAGVSAPPTEAGVAAPLVHTSVLSIPEMDPTAPRWAKNLAVGKSTVLGDKLGLGLKLNQIYFQKSVVIQAAGAAGAPPRFIAKVPIVRRMITAGKPALGGGTVWIAAALLDPGRGPSEFVGIRVKDGGIETSAPVDEKDEVWTLGAAWSLTLKLELDLPAPPTPVTSPNAPGRDLAEATVAPPKRATFILDHTGKRTIEYDTTTVSAFGTSVAFARSGDAPFSVSGFTAVVVPAVTPTQPFTFAKAASPLFAHSGASKIARAGWALTITETTVDGLAEAATSGYWWLQLNDPVRARWSTLDRDVAGGSAALYLAPQLLVVAYKLKASAYVKTLKLCHEEQSSRVNEVDFSTYEGADVMAGSAATGDVVSVEANVRARLDRPLQANGERLSLQNFQGTIFFQHTAAETSVLAIAGRKDDGTGPGTAFALVNGYISARPPTVLVLKGNLAADQVTRGMLQLSCPIVRVLPTLPDPYIGNHVPLLIGDGGSGTARVGVRLTWEEPNAAKLLVQLHEGDAAEVTASLVSRRGGAPLVIDVSSAADQFGFCLLPGKGVISVQNVTLAHRSEQTVIVTLPPISWEPVMTEWGVAGEDPIVRAENDGGLAGIVVRSDEPLPLLPVFAIQKAEEAAHSGAPWFGLLPLPFGLRARLDVSAETRNATRDASLRFHKGSQHFAGDLSSAGVLSVRGPKVEKPAQRDPVLPGRLELPGQDPTEPAYGRRLLTKAIADNLLSLFGNSPAGVPLQRYDLNGYGANVISHWRDPQAKGPAVVKAYFDVLMGRTAHEVVQVQSYLYPYYAKVVRTITFDRQPGGWVLRKDSGWIAVTDADFSYRVTQDPADLLNPKYTPFGPGDARIHKGAVERLINIRNIRQTGDYFDFSPGGAGSGPGPAWQAVTFDADVVFATAAGRPLDVENGAEGARVPTRGAIGWVLTKNIIGTESFPASVEQLRTLLARTGPGRAPINCGLRLGKSAANPGLAFRTSEISVQLTEDAADPSLVVAVHGIPTLPKEGSWSVARQVLPHTPPAELPPSHPIPLISLSSSWPASALWHFAEPTQARQLETAATTQTAYGFVQSLGTQKVFLPHPKVGTGPKPVQLPTDARFADVASLLGCASVFPGLDKALSLKSLKNLATEGNGKLIEAKETLAGAQPVELVDLGGGIRVLLEYKSDNAQPSEVRLLVDPSANPRWSLEISRVCFVVQLSGKPLISIFATVDVREGGTPRVSNLNVHYGEKLAPLQSLFATVQQVARFLPGGKDAGLRISLVGNRLSVINAFALPTLPLGAGQIRDITAEMGFDFCLSPLDIRFAASLGSQRNPFNWVVSPLAGTGMVAIGISKKGLDVIVQAGLGVGLCIDVGIASGSASVALAIELNTHTEPWLLSVILSGQASVEVLQGLVGATISLAAGFGISRPTGLPDFADLSIPKSIGPVSVDLAASVAVGIHVSVCWVVDVDWDGYWQFRQTLTMPKVDVPLL